MRALLLLLITVLCFNHSKAQTLNGNEKDIQTILKNTEDFSKHVMTSNYELIVASYTKDAKIFPNNTKILEGEDIITYWTLPEGVSITHHKITQSEITIVGTTAYDYGYYEGITKTKKGEEVSWKGKYVIVWKRVEGVWRMHLDIWNSVK